jgi:MoaA/NifB/PqqE/SkfB family radical SAM enzyme
MKSWVINNLLIGSKRRSQLEKKLGCTLPSLINITPTEKCNLSCLGCYALGYNRTREMTIHEINIIVQQARDLGIFLVGILGGEPFLRKDLFRVIEENKDIAFRISTNGTFLDPEIIGALKRCGNLVTFFSLEGFEEETDGWRGPGVYRKVMESMAVLKRERILFGFSALLHKDNVHSVVSHRFLDMMRDAGCKFGLFFPYGPAGDNARYNLRLTENQIAESFSLLDDLSRKYTMLFIMEGYTSPADSDHYVAEKGCRAGVTVNITPEGNVEPCNGIQFYSQNVFEAGLADVFRSPFYMDIFACVRKNDGRCVSMFASKEVLEIVKKDGAKGSYPRSFPTYQNYASCFPNPPRKKIERKRAMKEALS